MKVVPNAYYSHGLKDMVICIIDQFALTATHNTAGNLFESWPKKEVGYVRIEKIGKFAYPWENHSPGIFEPCVSSRTYSRTVASANEYAGPGCDT
jgi:hypothetical protein